MRDEKTRLQDILDMVHLQEIQDNFADVTKITTVIVGPDGNAITRPSNLHGFCETVQRCEAGRACCVAAKQNLCRLNRETHRPAVITCPLSGLTAAAVPLFLAGELLGSWVIEQVRLDEADEAVLQATAGDLCLDAEELKQEIDSLPRRTQEEFENILAFLVHLGDGLVRLSHARNEMARSNRELRETTVRLNRTAQMLRRFTDSTNVGMYICDFYSGEILMVNELYAQTLGQPIEEIIGRKCWQLGGGFEDFCPYCPRAKLLDAQGRPAEPYRWDNFNPILGRWLRCHNQAIQWVDGRLAHMVTYWDVTDERALQDKLARLAFYDQHMDLPNGLKLARDVDGQGGREQSLVCFDVAALRRVNNAYGRATGDELLKSIVAWAQGLCGEGEQTYRLEGDEFCLLLRHAKAAQAVEVAQKIHNRFAEPWPLNIDGRDVLILCGVAVSVLPGGSYLVDENLLNLIERTLDVSRESGRVAVFDEEMDAALKAHVRLELSLKSCVQQDMQGFSLHFQPIVDPAAGLWKGLEALCRWTDPDTGPVSPLVFIREAEQLGLIGQIGLWVLETAVRHCKQWGLDKVEGFFLSVNLSPVQIMDETLGNRVMEILERHAYPGQRLSLEITESTEFNFTEYTMKSIEKLREYGITIALDDFGTGYSSFNNLKNLPAGLLKTERDFIRGIEDDSYMQYLFYIMAELAHAADMKLIAEGVETKQQMDIILRNGGDYVQGYYFSKPMPPEEVAAKLVHFTQVNASFYTIGAAPMDLEQLVGGRDAYLLTPSLFRVLNHCMQILLSEADMDAAFNDVIAIVGREFSVSRVYVFLRDEGTVYSNTNEWCGTGTAPAKGMLQQVDVPQTSPGWLEMLERDGMIVASDIMLLPQAIRESLEEQDIKAIAVLPMWDADTLIGFVGFDDCRYRDWRPEEILMLRNLCMIMASSLKKEQLKRDVLARSSVFTTLLNRMSLVVFLVDMDTHEIVWANDTMQRLHPDMAPLAGKKCHDVLHYRQGPCAGCRANTLPKDTDSGEEAVWEFHDEEAGRDYRVYNSYVGWLDGRVLWLEYSLDITEELAMRRALAENHHTGDKDD